MNLTPELKFVAALAVGKEPGEGTAGLNWEEVFRLGEGNGVLPVLYQKLRDTGSLPLLWANRLEENRRKRVFADLSLAGEILRIHQLAEAAGIPHYFYKGKVWAKWLFGDIHMRMPGDIDLLVPPEFLFDFMDLLKANGYTPDAYHDSLMNDSEEVRRSFIRTDYHIPMYRADGAGRVYTVVEVHWKVAYPRLCFDFTPEEFRRNALPVPFQGYELPAFSNEFQFLLIIVHHGGKERWDRLKYLVDLNGYLLRYGQDTDWEVVARLAKQKGIYRLMLWSLGVLKALGSPAVQVLPFRVSPVRIENFFKCWQELKPLPENATLPYLVHGLAKRDWNRKLRVLKAHLYFFLEIRLHRSKLKWYRQHSGKAAEAGS